MSGLRTPLLALQPLLLTLFLVLPSIHVSVVCVDAEGTVDEGMQHDYDPTGLLRYAKEMAKQVKMGFFSKPPPKEGEAVQSGSYPLLTRDHNIVEGVSAVVLLLFALNLWLGSRYNKKIIAAWSKAFAAPGTLFDRCFSQLGPANSSASNLFIHESPNIAKLYASGRRHCQGALITLALRARQDAVGMFVSLVDPVEDQVHVEVYMNESSMQPMALAVAVPKFARHLQRDRRDIQQYTKKITISKDQLPAWPQEKLHVLAEHSSHFYDLFSDAKLMALFTPSNPQSAHVLKYFRSIHCTSDCASASHKWIIRFVFALPPPSKMEDLARLMDMVPLLIDVVAAFKLTPDLRKRALDTRAAGEKNEEEERKKRVEALQAKKQEKAIEEKLRVGRMTPEARAKYEEKQVKTSVKKSQTKKTTRV